MFRISSVLAAGEMYAIEIERSPILLSLATCMSDLCLRTVSPSMFGFHARAIPAFPLRRFPVGSIESASYFIGSMKRSVGRAQVSVRLMTSKFVESTIF